MRAPQMVATAVTAAFVVVAALHVYWAMRSATTGGAADAFGPTVPVRADGQPLFRPGPLGTLAVAVALAAAATLVLGRAGLVARVAPAALYELGTWVVGVVLLARVIGEFRYVGLFKRERGTRFATLDTRLYTPLCAVLSAGVFYVAAT